MNHCRPLISESYLYISVQNTRRHSFPVFIWMNVYYTHNFYKHLSIVTDKKNKHCQPHLNTVCFTFLYCLQPSSQIRINEACALQRTRTNFFFHQREDTIPKRTENFGLQISDFNENCYRWCIWNNMLIQVRQLVIKVYTKA